MGSNGIASWYSQHRLRFSAASSLRVAWKGLVMCRGLAHGSRGSMFSSDASPSHWRLPVLFAFAVLVTAGPLLWSRDLPILLLSLPYTVGLALISIVFFASGFFLKDRALRLQRFEVAAAGPAILALIFLLNQPASDFFHERVGFWLWYPSHQEEVARDSKRDAIITQWDDWGWAGGSSFSVLISDPDDSIGSSTERASVWARRLKSDCDVGGTMRLMHGVYMLYTSDCPLTDERHNEPQ